MEWVALWKPHSLESSYALLVTIWYFNSSHCKEQATPSDFKTRKSWTYLMCLQSILVWGKPVKPWSHAVHMLFTPKRTHSFSYRSSSTKIGKNHKLWPLQPSLRTRSRRPFSFSLAGSPSLRTANPWPPSAAKAVRSWVDQFAFRVPAQS